MLTTTPRTSQKNAIHAYVSDSIHAQFEIYRRQLGLTSGSSLLTLLILREIRLKRLAKVMDGRVRSKNVPRSCKITAYLDQPKIDEFRTLAEHVGRSVSDCAAELVDRELEEFWLLGSLGSGGFRQEEIA